MKEIFKKERGITLIALVITIIILLILSAVAIATLTGDRGLFKKASEAREAAKLAEAQDMVSLALSSARVEYELDNNMNLENYIKSENSDMDIEVGSNNDKEQPNALGEWTITYVGYEFDIKDLKIDGYGLPGLKPKATITVSKDYKFASISGSSIQVDIQIELPTELTGATINIEKQSGGTGTLNGYYDSTLLKYTGTITTDGKTNPNGSYVYKIKATNNGTDYIINKTVNVENFLDNPKIEVPENSIKYDSLQIKVTNSYPQEANISYKYYISETTTNNYISENPIKDTEVTKIGLKVGAKYNVKVEAYLTDETKVESDVLQVSTSNKLFDGVALTNYDVCNEYYYGHYKNLYDLLTNGIVKESFSYGGALLACPVQNNFIELCINKEVEIEVFCGSYSDSGGSTSGTQLIKSSYDPQTSVSTEKEKITTNDNSWVSLGKFSLGYYRLTCDKRYAVIAEMRLKE